MAKKSKIAKEKQRQEIVAKYAELRKENLVRRGANFVLFVITTTITILFVFLTERQRY